jgi:O-acetyl-ADP-ribose deacetylase (regulator of RNase III)
MNRVLVEHVLSTGQTLQLVEGDITAEKTDAIVNAANEYLRHGGGLAGAIVRAGGAGIQKESDAWVKAHGPVEHEHPAWTSAGQLPARYVIHAVGPVWGSGEESVKLEAAVRGSLELADELQCESVAFPAISTGIFGFPMPLAARVITSALVEYFADTTSQIQLVKIVVFDAGASSEFAQAWADMDWSAGDTR